MSESQEDLRVPIDRTLLADLQRDADEVWEFLSGLYERGELCFVRLERWLREHVRGLPRKPERQGNLDL